MKGWRPISVTYQPATVATQPEKVMPTRTHSSGRFHAAARQPARRPIHQPTQLTSSISVPTPTMTRKAQNTGATGGCRSRNSSRPLTSPSHSCVRMRLAPLGMPIS
jgi:hypothetical protein